MRKHKKKMDIFVGITFGYIFVNVIVAWLAFFLIGEIPDTLVQVTLGGGAVELAATAAIEIFTGKKTGG